MTPASLRVLLALMAAYMVMKCATARRRGAFLTLFGNVRPDRQPRAFRAVVASGYVLAALFLLLALVGAPLIGPLLG